MRNFSKSILSGLVVLIIVAIGLGGYIYSKTRIQQTGTIALAGLQGKVEIHRDGYGIPHIVASKNDNDAFFALGFVHAQDRFWQMEMHRRIAQGTLAAIFGTRAVTADKQLRMLGFYRAAQAAWPALNKHTKAIIHSYTMGVNAFLARGHLPLPFLLLRYKPKPWTDIDSIAWQKILAWDLQTTWRAKIRNLLIARQYGIQALTTFAPPYPSNAPVILSKQDLRQSKLIGQPIKQLFVVQNTMIAKLSQHTIYALQHYLQLARQVKSQLGIADHPGKGSNDWVVSGRFTRTGKPILANDPHLELQLPAIWYLAELKGPNLHVIGATLPGFPGVIIGHNDHIAWGMTNVNPDVQDIYIEPKNVKLKTITETIKVRNNPDVQFTVSTSKHGPIINAMLAKSIHTKKILANPIALKWTALQPGDTTTQSILALDYAQNWQQFVNALRYYITPSQNFVYADTQGNIGYFLPGKIPVRHGWDGALPVMPTQHREWAGFIPFNKLPWVYNPPEGFIASANNKAVANAYPYSLTFHWETPPYRIERIDQLLQRSKQLTIKDMQAIQTDVASYVWQALMPTLLTTKPLDDLSQQALTILKRWHGKMTMKSIGATIFAFWYRELNKMLPATAQIYQSFPNALFIYQQLLTNNAFCRRGAQQTCAKFLSKTLQQAMHSLTTSLGNNPAHWQWSKIHHADFNETGLGNSKWLGWIWNRSITTPGGYNTVNVGTYNPKNFTQVEGAGYRQIIDLANFNKSAYIITVGQSANPFSKHYNDQMILWRNGKYLPLSSISSSWHHVKSLMLLPLPKTSS